MKHTKSRNIMFGITFILMSIYLLWRVFFTLPIGTGWANLVLGVLLLGAEIVTNVTTFELYYRKIKSDATELEMPEIPHEYYPDVDVFIATHNEDTDLLYKTANACTFMEYPDKSKVHIYLCDDGNRGEVAELAKQLGIGYLGLADNKDAKSGNLNNALAKTNSPLIATFDADMIPQRTFLMKTVPYFFLPGYIKEDGKWRLRTEDEMDENYRFGLIQTPQSFYNPDLFQYNLYSENNIPNEQDFFSREVNVMRNSSNAIAYTGSNTVIAREAMEEIGGFPLKTITEDFETSVRIQKKGYITYATQEVQAAGLTTTTVQSMIKQRVRWARGVIQSIQNTNAVFTRDLSMAARITYLNSFLYWWSFFNRLVFILSPILFALFDFQLVRCELWELAIFWLPAYFCYSFSMRFLSSNIRTQRWSQIIDTILAPYMVIPVILETLGIHEKKFKVTNKTKASSGKKIILYAIPNLVLIVLSVLALIRYTHGKYGLALFYSCVILFWLSYNMLSLIYGVFFMFERRAPRKFERIKAQEDIVVEVKGRTEYAKTVDISDEGMMFCTDELIYLPVGTEFNIIVQTVHYAAKLKAKVVYIKEKDEKWYYATHVTPVDEDSKRQYYQIIYDRNHSLPKEMDMWSTAYDDIFRNIYERTRRRKMEKRQSARVAINNEVYFTDGSWCMVRDFNFNYLMIDNFEECGQPEYGIYRIRFSNGETMSVIRTGRYTDNKQRYELLKILNMDKLVEAGMGPAEIIQELKSAKLS